MDDYGNDLGHYFYLNDARTGLNKGWVHLMMVSLVSTSAYGGMTGDRKVDA